MKGRWIVVSALLGLLSASGPALGADEVGATAAGDSVVGLGLLPGAPELVIGTSGGNDVFQVGEGTFPVAYGGGEANGVNACLGEVGFADLGVIGESFTSKKHEYDFTFASGASVTSFSLVLLDWGDFLPYGGNADDRYQAALTAFDAGGVVVDVDVQGFTTNDTQSAGRVSNEYGNLELAGDACLATLGQPGRCPFSVSGPEIVRVQLRFHDRASMDPHVALVGVQYELTPPPPVGSGVEGVGFWKNHTPWPVESITLGSVDHTAEDALELLKAPVAGDMTFALVHQLIAAKLNVLAGNEGDCIADTLAAADDWLTAYPVGSGVKASSAAWKNEGASLKDTLEQYNQGLLCGAPGD